MKDLLKLIQEADCLYSASCDDFISIDAQDRAYEDYHKTIKKIATRIQEITNGKIDARTAARMAHFKRKEIYSLVSRLK